MNYESPINIISRQMEIQMEGEIMKAVQRVGVQVDKEELIRALQYDRDQYQKGYQKGYNDGFLDTQDPVMPTVNEFGEVFCGNCGQRLPRKSADMEINYCSYCGQEVKWE